MSPYTVKQFRQLVADQGKKGNKYNAKRSQYNGVWFDSIKEANYAELLDWRVKSKDIKGWDRQITFDLMVNAKKIAGIRPDFLITNNDGSQEIHEVKSFVTATPLWQVKWKLFQVLHPEYEFLVIK